jgi:PAS domain S-box-containing protein
LEEAYKILLVEDSAADAELIMYELKKARIKSQFKRVEQEETFLQALSEFAPDIVIADFNLPRFNALRALQLIKEKDIIIPFILVTGSQSEEIAVECIKNGADDYILKTSLTRLPTAFHNSITIKKETKTRLEAEKQLKESEAHKSAILNTAADSIITVDENGNIDLFNEAAESLFGYSAEEIAGKYIGLIIPDFQRVDVIKEFNQLIENKTKLFNNEGELVGRQKDGGIFFIELSVDKVVLPHKTFFVTIIRDITVRKLNEENIKYKNRELNTFVYRISHDLKGPISSILGLVDLANMELKSYPEAIRYNKLIRQSAFKLDNTLVELLKVLHVREADVEYGVANVQQMIATIIKKFADMGSLENIQIKIDIPPDLNFKTSIPLLSIALEKVIQNSIQFRKDFSSENFIHIKGRVNKDKLEIEIKDNGVGIDPSIQSKVYDMFFRGHNISKGNGLGLYLTKNVIEKLNGNIHLESAKDKGTTVKITIPEAMGNPN